MRYSITVMMNLAAVVLALVVVWVYARELFELAAIVLGIYFVWIIGGLVLQRRKQKEQPVSTATCCSAILSLF